MASGFFALLDDIAAMAKVAAASIDDAAAQAVKVGQKAAGIVIDDAAVTPRYVVGFSADRELPIIARIAWGSLKNKLVYLLPGALMLSLLAPWAITPLLMAGGVYLCFEGYEKLHELGRRASHEPADARPALKPGVDAAQAARTLEDTQVASAIRTDMILSAEIMAISLAAVETPSFWGRAVILGFVGALVTGLVYGAVALIVKADDAGLYLAQQGKAAATRALGRGLVQGMPTLLQTLSLIGTAAMLWVGGGIILHGLDSFGLGALPHAIHGVATSVGSLLGPVAGIATWLIDAIGSGIIGLAIGWAAVAVWSLFAGRH